MPTFRFTAPYTVDWQAGRGEPRSALGTPDATKDYGRLDFQLITPQPSPIGIHIPNPDRRNGGWVRMAVGQIVDPPPGQVMTINATVDLSMSWALMAMGAIPPHTAGAIGHTDAFVGLYVQEIFNGVVARVPVKWRWSMWDRTSTNTNIPLWGQSHQLPLNDAFAIRPGHYYVVWVWSGGSVAGQNRGNSAVTINRWAWAVSRLLVEVLSIKVGVF